jgi:hypothetical protein
MTEPTVEFNYLQAGLEELEAYLLSEDLFWSVTAPPKSRPLPKLTLGSLLLAIAKLKAYSTGSQLSPAQKTEYSQLKRGVEAHRDKWAVAWQTKAAREYTSRLRQWVHYLNELSKKEETHAPYYRSEVRIRVLLELLREYAPAQSQPDLDQLDVVLRPKLTAADFIWDAELQPAFPQKEYWFLYGIP